MTDQETDIVANVSKSLGRFRVANPRRACVMPKMKGSVQGVVLKVNGCRDHPDATIYPFRSRKEAVNAFVDETRGTKENTGLNGPSDDLDEPARLRAGPTTRDINPKQNASLGDLASCVASTQFLDTSRFSTDVSGDAESGSWPEVETITELLRSHERVSLRVALDANT